ncbi:hypothetical protein LT493_22620 [Streptomyces tricolor]|nr:hypothetical protein [Streptomyces tricolor]
MGVTAVPPVRAGLPAPLLVVDAGPAPRPRAFPSAPVPPGTVLSAPSRPPLSPPAPRPARHRPAPGTVRRTTVTPRRVRPAVLPPAPDLPGADLPAPDLPSAVAPAPARPAPVRPRTDRPSTVRPGPRPAPTIRPGSKLTRPIRPGPDLTRPIRPAPERPSPVPHHPSCPVSPHGVPPGAADEVAEGTSSTVPVTGSQNAVTAAARGPACAAGPVRASTAPAARATDRGAGGVAHGRDSSADLRRYGRTRRTGTTATPCGDPGTRTRGVPSLP